MSLQETQFNRCKEALAEYDSTEFVGTEAWKVSKGGRTMKLRPLNKNDNTIELHKLLIEKGLNVPKILSLKDNGSLIFKESAWWEGKTFREMITDKTITPAHYGAIGKFIAMCNNIVERGWNLGFVNYLPKNLFYSPEEGALCIDMSKLVWTMFPENAIVRYILTEDLVDSKQLTFDLRTAFLEGYRSIRPLNLTDVLKKQKKMLFGDENIIYDEDLFSETPEYRKVMPGKKILDLKSDDCWVAFEQMRQGAEYVYSTDIHHIKMSRELLKTSDYGKLVAYAHGWDGRDLHYKWVELNSDHFVNHLEHSNRVWDEIYPGRLKDCITPERYKKIEEMYGLRSQKS